MDSVAANEIFEGFSGDYTACIHYAKRVDGQWFTRMQTRDPRYGYKWGAWRPTIVPYNHITSTGRKARLPKYEV